jgi:methylmalonyl-CoA mutase
LTVERAFAGVVLGVSVDCEYFDNIVKLRAARLLWNRMTEACGLLAPARIEARSSGRMLTAEDAWTNLLRLTAAGFAAAVGGADAIVLAPFTEALGPSSDLARRQSRNIQLELMEEAHLGDTADPASGAWALERQTLELAQAAWDRFQAIEGGGGLLTALVDGRIAGAVARTRQAAQDSYAIGGRTILGVTRQAATEERTAPLGDPCPDNRMAPPRLPGGDDTCPALSPIRWAAPFETGA